MTHYYLFIKAGTRIDTGTQFFKVGLGESEDQTRKRAWLESYAFEHGCFFVRWSLDAIEFVIKCQQSIGAGHQEIIGIKGVDLIRYLKTGCEDPSFYQSAINRHKLLMQIDSNYYCYNQIKNKQTQYAKP